MFRPIIRSIIRTAFFILFFISCVSTQASYEEPDYMVKHNFEDVEIRQYKKSLVAEITQEGKSRNQVMYKSFRVLAEYISGQNSESTESKEFKIPMTRPVFHQQVRNKWKMSFFMPREWTFKTLPRPLNKEVRIRVLPSRKVAVLEFSGMWTDKNLNRHEQKLKKYLKRNKYKVLGRPIFAFYNSPLTPWFLRRNEVIYTLKK